MNRVLCFQIPRNWSMPKQMIIIFFIITAAVLLVMYGVLIAVIFTYRSKVLFMMHEQIYYNNVRMMNEKLHNIDSLLY